MGAQADDALELLIFAAGTAFAIWIGMAIFMYVLLTRLARTEKSIRMVVDGKARERAEDVFSRWRGWDAERGFVFQGVADTSHAIIVLWQHHSEPLYFCVFLRPDGSESLEFQTLFEGAASLNTSNAPEAMVLPAPATAYRQAFPRAYVEDLWERHRAAESLLATSLRKKPISECPTAYELMCEDTRSQIHHVRSLTLWPLRWPYWYFLRRTLWRNRSVEQQLASGRITLPPS